jgi:hypothetical protein
LIFIKELSSNAGRVGGNQKVIVAGELAQAENDDTDSGYFFHVI